jgi:hypothetical protein
MPQIDDVTSFVQNLEQNHQISSVKMRVAVGQLYPTQKHFDKFKVERIVAKLLDNDAELINKPIVISRDNFILDGHHRWAAFKTLSDNNTMYVHKVSAPIERLVDIAKDSGARSEAFKKSAEAFLRKVGTWS